MIRRYQGIPSTGMAARDFVVVFGKGRDGRHSEGERHLVLICYRRRRMEKTGF